MPDLIRTTVERGYSWLMWLQT